MADDTPAPIRIVIADDHPIFRDGLRRLLESEPGLVVVAEAGDGLAAVEQVAKEHPDILLLDLAMPGASGLAALEALAGRETGVRTVLLTASIERDEVIAALKLGARGILLKDSATATLYRCVRAVVAGEYWVAHDRVRDIANLLRSSTPAARGARATPAAQLTRRELQVIAAVVDGASNREVGAEFGVSEQTVKNHLSHIFDKLGVSNRLELALYVVHHGMLDRLHQARDESEG